MSHHYHWGHHERLPYDDKAVKSIYHVRQLEVHRLMQVGVGVGGDKSFVSDQGVFVCVQLC